MHFDVFISHSAKDKPTADAACAALEAAGIRCWIAPRDILPGADWGAAIIEALDHCQLLVLVFSSNANNSPQIRNEIVQAVNRGIAIVPIRIEDTLPTKALAYFMGSVHWLDALHPPLAKHLEALAGTVKILLQAAAQPGTAGPEALEQTRAPPASPAVRRAAAAPPWPKRNIWIVGILCVLVITGSTLFLAFGFLRQLGPANVQTVQLSSLPTAQDLQRVSDIASKHALPLPTFEIRPPLRSVPVQALKFVGIWASNTGYDGTGRQVMLIVTRANADSTVEGYYVQGPRTAASASSHGAGTLPFQSTVSGNSMSFTNVGTGTIFTAKFDVNFQYLTLVAQWPGGQSFWIVLNPVWRLTNG